MDSGRTLKSKAVSTRKKPVEDSAALSRRGLLIETVTTSVAKIITAPSVADALPAVLTSVASVVPIHRVVVSENLPAGDGPPAPTILFQWNLPGGTSALSLEQINGCVRDAAFQEWMRPLEQGAPVVTLRGNTTDAVQRILKELGVFTLLLVPIMIENRYWGQIGFDDCESEHEWAGDDIKILTMLAEVIGAAITRERFLRQAQQREQLLQAVTNCAAQIGTAPDLHEAIARSLGIVAKAVGVDRMIILEVTVSSLGVRRSLLRHHWHAPGIPSTLAQAVQKTSVVQNPDVIAWAAPLLSGSAVEGQFDSAQGGVKALFEQLQVLSVLVVPIMVDGRYWGHIGLDVCRHERAWSSSEVDVLKILADLLGTAITRERDRADLAKANKIIQNSPTILYRLGGEPSLPMIYVSQNIALLGHDPAQMVDVPTMYRDMIHPSDRDMVLAAMARLLAKDAPSSSMEFRILTKAGAVRWVENRNTPVRNGEARLIEIEGILTDITERKAAEEKIKQLARTDVLTGLANRMTFDDRLNQLFAAAQRGAHAFAVLYLDLDRFKEINDTLGHHAGDRLLQEVAGRLQNATRQIDLVARLGGDEFAILQGEVRDSSEAGTLAAKLIQVVSTPYSIDGSELRIGASVGISLYTADVDRPDALLKQADQALYRVKRAGRGQYRFHSDEIDQETSAHMGLAVELRNALARNELEVCYQPQVELAMGKIVSIEALLRWHHPTRGLLLPKDFLPIAEKIGIVHSLGYWILDHVCQQISLWRDAGLHVPIVTINVALAQIKMGREFMRDTTDIITRWGLSPSDIELDITERVLARLTLAQNHTLGELRQLGFGIAVDEFAAQYCSLDYVRSHQINRLKMAPAVIAAATAELGGGAMIRSILSLARELGMEVVAEGVESEAQRRLLLQISAHAQEQGFYYSRAVSATEATPMLQAGVLPPEYRAMGDLAAAEGSDEEEGAAAMEGGYGLSVAIRRSYKRSQS
jgi:diguanylate cyclase (GGDEF)-like protein/PAS domain S-box-containing protein